MKLKRLAAVIGLGLMGASATAEAYLLWRFEDDSIDFILRENAGGGFDIITGGAPQEGDIFVSIFEFKGAAAYPTGSRQGLSLIPNGRELTGVSVAQLITANPASRQVWDFEPYTGGMNSILAYFGLDEITVVGGDPGGGAMLAMWINDAPSGTAGSSPSRRDRNLILSSTDPDYGLTTNCSSIHDCLEEASLGTLFQVDGMWGVDRGDRNDPDNYWEAYRAQFRPLGPGTLTYDFVKNRPENQTIFDFYAALSNLYNAVQPVPFMNLRSDATDVCTSVSPDNPDGCVQVTVNGHIKGGTGLLNGAIARDNSGARNYVVPEPATLGLLGLGLLGLGLLRRHQG